MRARLAAASLIFGISLALAGCGDDSPSAPGSTGGGGGTAFNTSQLPDTFPNFSGYGNLSFASTGNLLFASQDSVLYEYERSTGDRRTVATNIGDGELLCAVWDPSTRLFYVGNTLSEIYSVEPSGGSSQRLTTVTTLGEIQQLLIAPSSYGALGGMLVAVAISPGGIVAVDQRNSASETEILPASVADIEFGPDGTLYAAQYGLGLIVRVASNGNTTVFADSLTNPEGIAIDTDGSRMWVASAAGIDEIIEITIPGEKKTVIATPELDTGYFPSGLAYDGFGNLLFLSYPGDLIIDFLDVK